MLFYVIESFARLFAVVGRLDEYIVFELSVLRLLQTQLVCDIGAEGLKSPDLL